MTIRNITSDSQLHLIFSLLISHIARYAPESARLNLRHICDPGVYIF